MPNKSSTLLTMILVVLVVLSVDAFTTTTKSLSGGISRRTIQKRTSVFSITSNTIAEAATAPVAVGTPSIESTITASSATEIQALSTIIDNTNSHVDNAITAGAGGGGGLSPLANTIVFIIGIIPFLWATYEFWSRIAVGSSFGTGQDSIQIRPSSEAMKNVTMIGKDGDLKKSRGQRVLGDDALIVAYFLFAVAIGSVGIAVYSVITSPIVSGSTNL